MRTLKTLMVLVFLFLTIGPGVAVADSVPLPDDIQITPPDANLPEQIKAFSGKWGGRWSSRQFSGPGPESILIVENITKDKANIIYAIGDCMDWRMSKSWRRATADVSYTKYKGKEVVLSFRSETSSRTGLEFWLQGDALRGEISGQGTSEIKMTRMP